MSKSWRGAASLLRFAGQPLQVAPLTPSSPEIAVLAPLTLFDPSRRFHSALTESQRSGDRDLSCFGASYLKHPGRTLFKHGNPLAFTSTSATQTISSGLHGVRLCSSVAIASFENGLIHLSVPLPSRDENCRFTIRPISSTVGEFLDALRAEDRGIESAGIYTQDGVRIAGSTPIHSVLNQDFDMRINEKKVDIQGLEDFRSAFESPIDDRLDQVKKLVAQLHASLNVTDHQVMQENKLQVELETLRASLAPFEERRQALVEKSHARTKRLTWIGLGLMGIQFGFLARLTWWEYSWDVMEPVTYFVTYGTIMGMYAYYCVTRQEYEFSAAYDREYLKWFHKRAKKSEFDVEEYNKLRESIAQVESDLRRLSDPLQKNLPITQPK